VKYGADINKEADDGTTSLYMACESGHIEVVKYIMQYETDINKEDSDGYTPFFFFLVKMDISK